MKRIKILLFVVYCVRVITSDNIQQDDLVIIDGDNESQRNHVQPASQRAGVKIRIPQKGLILGAELAVDMMMPRLRNLKMPDIDKKWGIFSAQITNLRPLSFPRPMSAVRTVPGVGLRWVAHSFSPKVAADFTVKMTTGLWNPSKSGNVSVHFQDLKLDLTFNLSMSAAGVPQATVADCQAFGDVSVTFQGGFEKALNAAAGLFRTPIARFYRNKLCHLITSCKRLAEGLMNSAPRFMELPFNLTLNYNMMRPPMVLQRAIEFEFSGGVSVGGVEVPARQPQPFPVLRQQHTSMAYVYISDSVLQGGLTAAHTAGLLIYRRRSQQLLQQIQNVLQYESNPTVLMTEILGNQGEVDVDMNTVNPPDIHVKSGNIHMTGPGLATIRQGSQIILEMDTFINVTAKLVLTEENAFIQMIKFVPEARVRVSNIGNRVGQTIVHMFPNIVKELFADILKVVTVDGFPFPKARGLRFVNPSQVSHPLQSVLSYASDFDLDATSVAAQLRDM